MRAKFSDLEYKAAAAECCTKQAAPKEDWLTAERIAVKENYTAEDLEGMEHLNYAAGIAPFLRGPYSTMYVMRPWPNYWSFRFRISPSNEYSGLISFRIDCFDLAVQGTLKSLLQ